MKNSIIIFNLIWISTFNVFESKAQTTDTLELPNFNLLRAEENYSFFKNQTLRNTFWKKLKYMPLGNNSFVSVGGSIRSEIQKRTNEDWVKQQNVALFQRFMFHTDFRLHPNFRIFNQFKSGYTIGRDTPFFLDNDDIDFHQLFFEFRKKNYQFRLGRQELALGAKRLMSVREGTNIRQSFDGFRLTFMPDLWNIDILGLAYNPQRVNAFDNRINTDELLWGVYATRQLHNKQQLLDFYYLGFQNLNANYVETTGKEVRHSLGARWAGSINRLKLNNEAVFQFGNIDNQSLIAWTVSADLNYIFENGLLSSVGLKLDIISGDKSETATLESFNALYPRGGYFGLLALIGPSNLIDIHPSIGLSLTDNFSVGLDVDVFWRYSLDDGIYFPSGRLNRTPDGANSRFIGYQTGIQLAYTINRHFSVESSYFHFFNGDFMEEITANNDISQLTFTSSFTF